MNHPDKSEMIARLSAALETPAFESWGTTEVWPMLCELKRAQALEHGDTAVALYWLHRREGATHREAFAAAENGAAPAMVLHDWAEPEVQSLRERHQAPIEELIEEGNRLVRAQSTAAEAWDTLFAPEPTPSRAGSLEPEEAGPPTVEEDEARTNPSAISRRGPRPVKREKIAAQMVADYAGDAVALREEKQAFLATRYEASRDTVEKARRQARSRLETPAKLRQIATIDK